VITTLTNGGIKMIYNAIGEKMSDYKIVLYFSKSKKTTDVQLYKRVDKDTLDSIDKIKVSSHSEIDNAVSILKHKHNAYDIIITQGADTY
jgi:hypothetical protein